jgi:hypothetical protein
MSSIQKRNDQCDILLGPCGMALWMGELTTVSSMHKSKINLSTNCGVISRTKKKFGLT